MCVSLLKHLSTERWQAFEVHSGNGDVLTLRAITFLTLGRVFKRHQASSALHKGRRCTLLNERKSFCLAHWISRFLFLVNLLLAVDLEDASRVKELVHLFLVGVGVGGDKGLVYRRVVVGELWVAHTRAVTNRQILERSDRRLAHHELTFITALD